MTETANSQATTETQGEPVTIHFLEPMSVCISTSAAGMGRVLAFGDELEITEEVRAASRDRNGNSWLAWLDEGKDEYVRRGRVVCRRGVWPEGQLRLAPGSFEWEEARRKAIDEALSIKDPAERRAARKRVDEEYGPGRPTSRTLSEVHDRDGRVAE